MNIVIKRRINKNGLLAEVVFETVEFDVTAMLCESKEGKKYLKMPQEKYTNKNGEEKYKYLVWMKVRYNDVLTQVIEKYEENASSSPADEIPF